MTTAFTYYRDIPKRPRTLLDEIYTVEGVQIWWNARHGWLANLRPREEWRTNEGRERVLAVIEQLVGGGW